MKRIHPIHTTPPPPPLSHIPSPPDTLYIQGSLSPTPHLVAIVGTRNPLKTSLHQAHHFAYTLAKEGCIIISGLAYGIDASAHIGALEAEGITWAVCAHGLDRMYPQKHTSLALKIIEQNGALISEYPPHTPPHPKQFLSRNRIISGLASALIIIEAPKRSGTLNTAGHALNQGKEIYVLRPPYPHDKRFEGSESLIKDGAPSVSTPQEFLSLHTFYPLT